MKTITQHIREHLLNRAGVPIDETTLRRYTQHTLADLRKSEWNEDFERLMRNRMIMGYFRYGALDRPNKPNYDHLESAIKRLTLFKETGNAEHLVDVANMCLLTFHEEKHPTFHFKPSDDGYHTPVKEEDSIEAGLITELFRVARGVIGKGAVPNESTSNQTTARRP